MPVSPRRRARPRSAAAVAARRTSLTGRPDSRASAATSSYSTLTFTTRPSDSATFTPTRPPSTSTEASTRSSATLPTGTTRSPMVDVVAKTAACTSGTVSGRQSTERVCAGRPFFIRIGVSQASEAPAAKSASRTPGHSRGSRSSMLASSTTGPALLPSAGSPSTRRTTFGSSPGSRPPAPVPTRATRIGGQRRPLAHQLGHQGGAGRGAHLGRHRAGDHGDPGQQLQHRRTRDRDDAVRAAGGTAAQRDGGGGEPGEPEVREPGDDADDVGQRVERAHLVEVHLLGGDPVHPALGDGQPLEDRQRPLAHGGGQCGVEEHRADVGPGPVLVGRRREHVHAGRAQAVPGDRFRGQPDRLHRQRGDGGGRDVERDAGIDERPEQHVARGPGGEVQPPDGHGGIIPGRRRS